MWRTEILRGIDAAAVARALVGRGILIPEATSERLAANVRIPGFGVRRVYHLAPRILAGEDDA